MPLVQGHSHVKWHLPHSIHSDHRGRTPKASIANHRVDYSYSRLVPVRIAIDKAGSLSECPIEFEVIQEFPLPGTATGDEKITLGRLTLNLAEYVEESEAVIRDTGFRSRGPGSGPAAVNGSSAAVAAAATATAAGAAAGGQHGRKRSSLSIHTPVDSSSSPKSTSSASKDALSTGTSSSNNKAPSIKESTAPTAGADAQIVEDGIVRRYLMTDSKINSTLKVGILMVQLDGERNFVAPPLKTAAVFGGIGGVTSSTAGPAAAAGIAAAAGLPSSSPGPRHLTVEDLGQHFQDLSGLGTSTSGAGGASGGGAGGASSTATRDAHELHDMYRRTLAASWACQPGELPADECIEDIFQGGDGFDPDAVTADGHGAGVAAGDSTPRGPGAGSRGSAGGTIGSAGGSGAGGGSGHGSPLRRGVVRREDSGSSSATGETGADFLRPGPPAAPPSPRRAGAGGRRHHARHGSAESTASTLRHEGGGMGSSNWGGTGGGSGGGSGGGGGGGGGWGHQHHQQHRMAHRRDSSKDSASSRGGSMMGLRSRSGSMASLAGTMEMERGRSGFKSAREVREWEIRDDFVAWKLPRTAS